MEQVVIIVTYGQATRTGNCIIEMTRLEPKDDLAIVSKYYLVDRAIAVEQGDQPSTRQQRPQLH